MMRRTDERYTTFKLSIKIILLGWRQKKKKTSSLGSQKLITGESLVAILTLRGRKKKNLNSASEEAF